MRFVKNAKGADNRNGWSYVKWSKTLTVGVMILFTVYCNIQTLYIKRIRWETFPHTYIASVQRPKKCSYKDRQVLVKACMSFMF